MGATSTGAMIGGAIDAMSGDDDSVVDGAIIGAVVANVIKFTVPLAFAGTLAWMAYRGVNDIVRVISGDDGEQAA